MLEWRSNIRIAPPSTIPIVPAWEDWLGHQDSAQGTAHHIMFGSAIRRTLRCTCRHLLLLYHLCNTWETPLGIFITATTNYCHLFIPYLYFCYSFYVFTIFVIYFLSLLLLSILHLHYYLLTIFHLHYYICLLFCLFIIFYHFAFPFFCLVFFSFDLFV